MLLQFPITNNPEVDLNQTYDAVVVGSGAAGGMAAHVLTSHGLKVLLLEAGKYQDTSKILHSMEWPYDHPRRGKMPSDYHALNRNEYTFRKSPYAQNSPYKKVTSYVQEWGGSDYSKTLVVDEKENPYSGTRYAWVRSRVVGGKTNIWGRLALRLSDYDFKAKDHDGWGENWPISYADLAPYYDKVDLYLGVSGFPEGLPQLPDGKFMRPLKLNYSELYLRKTLEGMGRCLTPYRAGVATDTLKHNKYRSHCYGRGACDRHVGGCDIHAAFDSTNGLIRPAMDTGNLTLRPNSTVYEVTVDKNTGKATGVSFLDSDTKKSYQVKARTVLLAASTLESARLLLLSKSSLYPNGIANSSGHVGHNFCEHVMGPSINGFMPELVGKQRTLDDGKPGGFYVPRFRNLETKQKDFIRGYGFEGSGGCGMVPGSAFDSPGFGEEYKKHVREYAGATISMGGFGEVLARYENQVEIDPELKDAWGIPVLRFNYRFAENEKKMCEDMAKTAREMFEAAKFEILSSSDKMLPEGWSIHELGTSRMGNDSKTSVVNQFQQSHDVNNLFVVDGSTHVTASAQNPTWTIMALCWRSCDHLADQLQKGEI
ncbi:MAG: GMC family oxidoreductase [Acidobacteriaceae bacterium]|nr:GMC family oxidoreductase [Acidobacteriaceae bacterium]MBV9498848.1 GMC family oxidoreductase [Acidobacteriaceae bacterium]